MVYEKKKRRKEVFGMGEIRGNFEGEMYGHRRERGKHQRERCKRKEQLMNYLILILLIVHLQLTAKKMYTCVASATKNLQYQQR